MLYLIKSGVYSKIGYAKDFNDRVKSYKTHNPDFQILGVKEGTVDDEAFYHKKYKEYLLENRYEWMELPADLLEGLKEEFEEFIPCPTNKSRYKMSEFAEMSEEEFDKWAKEAIELNKQKYNSIKPSDEDYKHYRKMFYDVPSNWIKAMVMMKRYGVVDIGVFQELCDEYTKVGGDMKGIFNRKFN